MTRAPRTRMGRPPIDNPKTERKQLCMTPEVAETLEQAAKAAGEPLGVYVVDAALARAKRETVVRGMLNRRRTKTT